MAKWQFWRHALACLSLALLLSACVNDGASFDLDGTRQHTISLLREQTAPWSKRVDLYIIVSRMPHCTRRHTLGVGTANSKVEIYQVPSGAFIIKLGRHLFATESQTCESWAPINGEPEGGMGVYQGVFRQKNGVLIFEPAPVESAAESTNAANAAAPAPAN